MRNPRDNTYPTKTLEELLTKGTHWQSNKLRLRLIQDGVKEKRCEICGLTHWQGGPAPLELDHIDGDRTNHKFNNLRIICPNLGSNYFKYII